LRSESQSERGLDIAEGSIVGIASSVRELRIVPDIQPISYSKDDCPNSSDRNLPLLVGAAATAASFFGKRCRPGVSRLNDRKQKPSGA